MRTPVNGIAKERISITVDAEVLEKVRIMAERDDRSLSQFINRVLKKAVRTEDSED
ncbi:MAG: ribbon-helix-helix protein, CopG family [Stomatobaculum sp.]|nr:ribbon-helix-helix protein, CopG family [Stomatobaculum sp.]